MLYDQLLDTALYALERGCTAEYVGLGRLRITPDSLSVADHAGAQGFQVERQDGALVIHHCQDT